MSTRIVIVDDHPLFRGALAEALSTAIDAAEIVEAGSLEELMGLLATQTDVDLILLDLAMPGIQGLSGLLYLRAERPEIPVMIVSASDDAGTIRRAIGFGASGYVPKSQPVEQMRHAVRQVLEGAVWTPPEIELKAADPSTDTALARLSTLTPQQVRVLMMLGEGLPNKEIAFRLHVSEATIKAHMTAVLQKLDVDNRTQAVIVINRLSRGETAPAG
jgi:DNA-binding NarL/FixJ family response regulator